MVPIKLDGGIQYIATVNIGTPSRALNLVIDTGSSDILILLKNHHRSEQDELRDEKSSTLKMGGNFDIKYGAGRCSGLKGSDMMTIGGYSLTGEEIGFANKEDRVVTTINADGVLGLALVGLSKITRPPFMAQLMQEHEDSLQNVFR
jgi:cathepsin D